MQLREPVERPALNPAPVTGATSQVVVRIEPSKGWVHLQLRDLWLYRELLYFLAWRDVKVRYKQTALGVIWAILQPFLTMVVFSVFFGHLAKVPSNGIPYPVFTYVALVPWTFFANGLTQAAGSLVSSANMISKVYFPRLVVPIASVFSGLLDLLLASLVLVGLMAYYGISPTINVLFLPFFVLLALVACLSVGIWLAALNVEYRDVRYVLPFLVQIWLFATPIAYPSNLVHGPWRLIYGLNPMVGVIDGFRWALLGTSSGLGLSVVVSALVSFGLLIGGMLYFRRMERTFADVI